MKKIYLTILSILLVTCTVVAQQYSYYPYGGSSVSAYSVPDENVSDVSVFHMLDGDNYGIGKDAREFDQVSSGATSSLAEDEGKTFGIHEPYSSDTGGGEIRGWMTSGDDAGKYSAVRWNANPGVFRQAGQWAYYTVNITETGSYNLYMRIRGTNGGHNYSVTAYKASDMAVIKEWTLDMNDFPWGLDSTKNGVTHVGDARADKDGQAGSEWMRINTAIEIAEVGNVVLKIDNTNAGESGSFGAFTFMKSVTTDIETAAIQGNSVYPNPVKDVLYFNKAVNEVAVINIAGQTLMLKQGAQLSSIELSSINSGIYFVRLASDDQVFIQKILKQ